MTPYRLQQLRHHAERGNHVLSSDVIELVEYVERVERELADARAGRNDWAKVAAARGRERDKAWRDLRAAQDAAESAMAVALATKRETTT